MFSNEVITNSLWIIGYAIPYTIPFIIFFIREYVYDKKKETMMTQRVMNYVIKNMDKKFNDFTYILQTYKKEYKQDNIDNRNNYIIDIDDRFITMKNLYTNNQTNQKNQMNHIIELNELNNIKMKDEIERIMNIYSVLSSMDIEKMVRVMGTNIVNKKGKYSEKYMESKMICIGYYFYQCTKAPFCIPFNSDSIPLLYLPEKYIDVSLLGRFKNLQSINLKDLFSNCKILDEEWNIMDINQRVPVNPMSPEYNAFFESPGVLQVMETLRKLDVPYHIPI